MYLKSKDLTTLFSRLETLEREILLLKMTKLPTVDNSELLDMPDHVRKTYTVVLNHGGESSATAVSEVTHRARAVESMYLNRLVAEGRLEKHRQGKEQLFRIPV